MHLYQTFHLQLCTFSSVVIPRLIQTELIFQQIFIAVRAGGRVRGREKAAK